MNKIVSKLKIIMKDKKVQKIGFSVFLALILFSVAFLTVSLFSFYSENVKGRVDTELFYTFEANTISYNSDYNITLDSEQFLSYGVSYGVDVSEWQGDIDWQKVKNTGISFAMIRCGFRQTVGSEIKEDAAFRKNIKGAINAGLKVGVYFFGTAKNKDEALEEAEFTYNLIKDYELSYPIAYDFETFNDGRLKGVDYSSISDNILTYTETLADRGYVTMIYSYKNAFSLFLDTGKFDGKLIWLAHFVDSTDYKGNFHMWQYTSEGRVDGIKTNVDLNVSYFDFVDSEDKIVENPLYVSSPEVDFTLVDEKVKTRHKSIYRNSASTIIPNKLGYIDRGTELIRIGISNEFSKVSYNGRIVYILNSDLVKKEVSS